MTLENRHYGSSIQQCCWVNCSVKCYFCWSNVCLLLTTSPLFPLQSQTFNLFLVLYIFFCLLNHTREFVLEVLWIPFYFNITSNCWGLPVFSDLLHRCSNLILYLHFLYNQILCRNFVLINVISALIFVCIHTSLDKLVPSVFSQFNVDTTQHLDHR